MSDGRAGTAHGNRYQPAGGTEDAPDLSNRLAPVVAGHRIQRIAAEDGVDGSVRKRQRGRVAVG